MSAFGVEAKFYLSHTATSPTGTAPPAVSHHQYTFDLRTSIKSVCIIIHGNVLRMFWLAHVTDNPYQEASDMLVRVGDIPSPSAKLACVLSVVKTINTTINTYFESQVLISHWHIDTSDARVRTFTEFFGLGA
jgi:hypothetical protein